MTPETDTTRDKHHVPRRVGEAMLELGRHHRYGAGCLKDGEDRGGAPACLMGVSAT
jgi:hypothetical protein